MAGRGRWAGIRELAEHTPASRERHLDLLRAVAIAAVVLGHWLAVVVEHGSDGRFTGFSALGQLAWAHPLTWLFQVMPIFFLVGGYANAASLSRHRDRGGSPTGWLLARNARLVRPTAVLLVVIAGTATMARLAGAAPQQIGVAAWLASIPLWFLAVYLGMIALTPVMHALHRRAGLAVPLLLLVLVGLGDALRFWSGTEVAGWGNFAAGWLAVHQIGFAWYDGRLPTSRRGSLAVFAGGLGALVLLTVPGPYPVSMVTVPGAAMQNSSPPTVALLALATAQLGVALLVRDVSERWLRRPRPWLLVVAANSVILTLFLWHMSAVVLAAVGLDVLGLLPTPPVDTAAWLWWQIPWVALLAIVLAGLVAVFGRWEIRAAASRPRQPEPRHWARVLTGYAATLGGLVWIAAAGSAYHGRFALPAGALVLFLGGALVLRLPRGTPP